MKQNMYFAISTDFRFEHVEAAQIYLLPYEAKYVYQGIEMI